MFIVLFRMKMNLFLEIFSLQFESTFFLFQFLTQYWTIGWQKANQSRLRVETDVCLCNIDQLQLSGTEEKARDMSQIWQQFQLHYKGTWMEDAKYQGQI